MSNIDTMSVNAIRVLSADGVQKANSGHPGLPLGAAAMAYELWAKHMKHNPKNPKWINRDRFILSGGHGSMLLYSLLHLFGYGLTIDDLKQFRQDNSLTPGHPEYKKAIPLIAFCLIPQYFLLLQYVFGVHFMQTKELKYVSWGGIITAIISLIGNATFIYLLGIPGAIISNTITQGGLLVYYYFSGQKILPINYHYRLILANGIVYMLYLIVLLLAVFFVQDFYLSTWVIASLIAAGILLVVNYELTRLFGCKIMNLIKTTFRRRAEKSTPEALS
jgi:hypothetical protein